MRLARSLRTDVDFQTLARNDDSPDWLGDADDDIDNWGNNFRGPSL